MSNLVGTLLNSDTRTENGMVTLETSLNACVDLFFGAGQLRNADNARILNTVAKAYAENPLTATRIIFWARDVRGGAGERRVSRIMLKYLADSYPDTLRKNLHLIPEYGRWDDVADLFGTAVEKDAINLIADALKSGNHLCAKWMPRPKSSSIANRIRKAMKLTPKDFRKLLVKLSEGVVEQKMCAKEFDKITYEHVPSVAMSRYQSAFNKRDGIRFNDFKSKLQKGEVKVNASALYPYDVLRSLRNGDIAVSEAQWTALPNYLINSTEKILCVVDTSASMFWDESQITNNIYAGDVAQSLALYVSERMSGPFKDTFMTFNTTPKLIQVAGSLTDRVRMMSGAPVGGATNLMAVFDTLLKSAKACNASQSDMPTMILIFSDMEFDQCVDKPDNTAMQSITNKYKNAGYELPKIVFWGLVSRNKNIPVEFNKDGTALVSGFSPSIMKTLLSGTNFTPVGIMNETVNAERYVPVKI